MQRTANTEMCVSQAILSLPNVDEGGMKNLRRENGKQKERLGDSGNVEGGHATCSSKEHRPSTDSSGTLRIPEHRKRETGSNKKFDQGFITRGEPLHDLQTYSFLMDRIAV